MAVLLSSGNLPCMIHTNEPIGHSYPGKTPVTLEQIYQLAKTFPDNRIVLAHWGGGLFVYNVMKKEVKQTLNNIWFDTAASPYLYDPAVYSMAETAGMIDKILFGTDYPLLTPERYFKDMKNSGLSPENINKICFSNVRKAYF
jgi:predicted TIM-barrel fold metal-dependent hydrolase